MHEFTCTAVYNCRMVYVADLGGKQLVGFKRQANNDLTRLWVSCILHCLLLLYINICRVPRKLYEQEAIEFIPVLQIRRGNRDILGTTIRELHDFS